MKPSFPQRRENLRKALRDQSTQNFLVTNITNVGYLTGFTGSSAYLLMTNDQEILLSDGRYTEQIASECPDLEVEIRPVDSTLTKLLAGVVTKSSITSLLIESDTVTRAFSNQLESLLSNVDLVDSSGIVEHLRAIKDDVEIATIRDSIAINEKVFQDFTSNLSGGMTEREIGFALEQQMRSLGAEKVSFEPIVAAGPNSALAHYHGGEKAIRDERFLLLDWGTQLRGYASDLTRMVYWGDVDPKMAEIHDIVLSAQLAAIQTVRASAALKEVDHAARSVIVASGYGDNFNHGLGHGIGLEIHEHPFMSPSFSGNLEANMVITIEPGIYLPGIGGVRIEDDILVTDDGFEVLSSLPKSFEESQFKIQ